MIGVALSIALLAGAVAFSLWAVIDNQLHPSYETALGIAYALLISLVASLLGLAAAGLAYWRNHDLVLAKRLMLIGTVCVVAFALLLVLGDTGSLSRIS